MANYIQRHIRLENNSVFAEGKEIFSIDKDEEFKVFAKSVYKNYEIKYGKFYKMDALSKLGFLASELLLKDFNKDDILPEQIAIICANTSASLHTDVKYQNTLKEIPSPALFVYTLPNIVLGEISIRNMIRGESLFLVQDKFDADFMAEYVDDIFENTNTELCITGWLEISANEEYKANLFLVSKQESNTKFKATELKN